MTPVIFLSDGYIANGSEPWRFPGEDELSNIKVEFLTKPNGDDGKLFPYARNEYSVRPWIKPGTKGLEHRIGGLEKQIDTGAVCYEPMNHELMVRLREDKIRSIENFIPLAAPDSGSENAKLLVLGWGSTYGSIKAAMKELLVEGYEVAHVHLRNLNPFPKNLGELLHSYDQILIPEMNCGQLLQLIRAKYLVPAIGLSKVQGQPFTTAEIKNKIVELLKA